MAAVAVWIFAGAVIVVVNIGNADVLTFSPEGKLLRTEAAAQPGNDANNALAFVPLK